MSQLMVVLQQDLPSPHDIDGGDHHGGEERVSDTSWSKAGQIDDTVSKPIRGIDQIDEERPAAQSDEPVSNRDMESGGNGLRQKSRNTAWFRTVKGQEIFEIIENDERVIDCADEQ